LIRWQASVTFKQQAGLHLVFLEADDFSVPRFARPAPDIQPGALRKSGEIRWNAVVFKAGMARRAVRMPPRGVLTGEFDPPQLELTA
jgi:hypothetical protein